MSYNVMSAQNRKLISSSYLFDQSDCMTLDWPLLIPDPVSLKEMASMAGNMHTGCHVPVILSSLTETASLPVGQVPNHMHLLHHELELFLINTQASLKELGVFSASSIPELLHTIVAAMKNVQLELKLANMLSRFDVMPKAHHNSFLNMCHLFLKHEHQLTMGNAHLQHAIQPYKVIQGLQHLSMIPVSDILPTRQQSLTSAVLAHMPQEDYNHLHTLLQHGLPCCHTCCGILYPITWGRKGAAVLYCSSCLPTDLLSALTAAAASASSGHTSPAKRLPAPLKDLYIMQLESPQTLLNHCDAALHAAVAYSAGGFAVPIRATNQWQDDASSIDIVQDGSELVDLVHPPSATSTQCAQPLIASPAKSNVLSLGNDLYHYQTSTPWLESKAM
jgi:hypothetical protein